MSGIDEWNRTELVETARAAGIGNVRRTQARDSLHALLEGVADPADCVCPLEGKRSVMQQHIEQNWRRLRTQLPGCTGKCVSHGCPNIIVQRCWKGFAGDIL